MKKTQKQLLLELEQVQNELKSYSLAKRLQDIEGYRALEKKEMKLSKQLYNR